MADTAETDLASLARRYCLQNAVQHEGTCQAKSLMGRIMGAHPEFRDDPGAVMKALTAAGEAVNGMALADQKAELEAAAPELLQEKKKERRTGLKPLPGVDLDDPERAKVVLRFAPNPNGPLSFGHSRGVVILSEYAKEYDARLILRLDDTDPQVKPPLVDPERGWNGYDMVREDWQWLAGSDVDDIVMASDRMPEYYQAARDLLDRGGAYVCTCDAEAWRDMKNEGEACEHREEAPEVQLDRFERMVDGDYAAGTAVLRVKTDIQHKDPALRDWTAMRVVAATAVHPREKAGDITRHVCWPLLDFESAVEDHLQGVTHVIRGKDLMDSTKKQQFLYDHMGWDYPQTLYWGRIRMHEFGRFSTSWMRQKIEAGAFSGWDDPRLPTLRALRRRGFQAAALRAFWIGLGLTEKDIAVSMENLEAENQKLIDAGARRYFFVPDPETVSVSGVEDKVAKPLLYPSAPDRGHRELVASGMVLVPGDELASEPPQIRLKDLGNIVLAAGTAFFSGEELDRSMPIVQWLPKPDARPFTVLRPGTLDPDAPEGSVPDMERIEGAVEPAALERVGDVVRFERFGFVRIEDDGTGIWLHD